MHTPTHAHPTHMNPFRLVPRRIAHYAGIVLDVIVANNHPPDILGGRGQAPVAAAPIAAAAQLKEASAPIQLAGLPSSRGFQEQGRDFCIRLSSGSNTDTHSPTRNVTVFAATKINTSDSNRLSVNRD